MLHRQALRMLRGISWGANPPHPAPRGSWACERQTKGGGRVCSGRERQRVLHLQTLLATYLELSSWLLEFFKHKIRPPHRKGYIPSSLKSCFVLLFHIQIWEQGTEAWLLPSDAQVKRITAQLPCWNRVVRLELLICCPSSEGHDRSNLYHLLKKQQRSDLPCLYRDDLCQISLSQSNDANSFKGSSVIIHY